MQHAPTRSHGRLLTAALALALAACSARGPGGSLVTGDGGGAATLSFTCAQFCASLASEPTCGAAGVNTCESSCNGSLASAPAACVAGANALYDCTRAATPRCATASQFPFASCQSQYAAYVACVASPPDAGTAPTDTGVTNPTDLGTTPADLGTPTDECSDAANCGACTGRSSCGWCAGRCWRGSSSGPTGGSCGGAAWAWTSGQCSAAPADAGIAITPACQTCAISRCPSQASTCSSDNVCLQCVASPDATCFSNPNFSALFACACGACSEMCGPECRPR
ncbi:MAG: hypothetical protein JWM10_497 [Myxococcaceae bacterium]|nr:hypothetical protein [Myxococcaceae bacterium]